MEAPLLSVTLYKNTSLYIVQSNKIKILMFKFWLLCLMPWQCTYLMIMTFSKFWVSRYTDLLAWSDNWWRVQIYPHTGPRCVNVLLPSVSFPYLTLFHHDVICLLRPSLSLSLSAIPLLSFLLSFFMCSIVYSYFWYGSKHKCFVT